MKLVKSLLMASVGLAILGSQVSAADYFVKPLTPGPVANTPLAALSLQATLPGDESVPSAEQSEVTGPAVLPNATENEVADNETAAPVKAQSTSVLSAASSGAKWVRARDTKASAGATRQTAPSARTGSTSVTQTLFASRAGRPSSKTQTPSAHEPTTPVVTTPAPEPTTPVVTPPAPTGSTGTGTGTGTTSPTPAPAGPAPVQTAGQTYNSLGALLQTGKVTGGDRIFLLGGYHGPMVLSGLQFNSPVTITSMPGQVAHVDSINVRASKKIIINNLKVWPSSNANGLVAQIRTYNDTSELVFSDLDVRSTANSTNYRQWSITDWGNYRYSGFLIDGQNQIITRNRVTGVYHGIFLLGQNNLAEENIVDGFAGDAYRALGDGTIVRRNKGQNCHQTNGTHTDGIQSFSRGATGKVGTGVLRNVTIEGNKFLEFVGTRSPINCKLQGIGLFDGMFEGFVIRNNLVSTTAYHGITLGGGLNSVIANNTVIHAQGVTGRWPWIVVSNHKNGTPSQNVTVANNMATWIKVTNNPSQKIVETNNLVVTNAAGEFTSVANQDFSLKSTSTAIDKGAATLAPQIDINKVPRPKGKAPDIGAYESF